MKKEDTLQNQYAFMKHLNLLILVYIGVVTIFSVYGCIKNQDALEFLNSAKNCRLSNGE